MHAVATQALAGATLPAPRTFDLNVQLGPQDGSQQTDDPSAVESAAHSNHAIRGATSSSQLPVSPVFPCCWRVGMWPHVHHSGDPSSASEVEQETGSTCLESVSQNCGDSRQVKESVASSMDRSQAASQWLESDAASEPAPRPTQVGSPAFQLCELPRPTPGSSQPGLCPCCLQGGSVDWYDCQGRMELW